VRHLLRLVPAILLVVASSTVMQANCANGTISLSKSRGAPDSAVTVKGHNFKECHDVGPPRPQEPSLGIEIVFVQGKTRFPVAVVDANSKFEFSKVVQVPAEAKKGYGQFVVERRDWVPLQADFSVTVAR
jgi:hypothetical protein